MRKSPISSSSPNAEEKALAFFTEQMIKKLEDLKGDAKWQKPWFSDAAMGWPRNLSGREYQASNAILLKMMCEKINWRMLVFSTFNRLTALNIQKGKDGEPLPRVTVNKGEKSTPVFLTRYTCVNSDTKEKISYEDYKQLDPEEQKKFSVYPKLHVYPVFNISQTNLKEARPELYAKLEEQNRLTKPKTARELFSIPEIDAMVERQRFYCPILHENKDACYYSISKDHIMMQPKETFKTGEEYILNLGHEASHALGAQGRLDRFTPEKMSRASFHSDEELIAELSAALMCSRYQILKPIKQDSVPYIKSWLDNLKESPSYIRNVMNDVKKTNNMLMNRINEVKLELEIEKGQQSKQAAEPAKLQENNQPMNHAGTYSIPDWSLPYIIYGDPSGLEDSEIELVDSFVKEHFPDGFTANIQWEDPTEFNISPAFGERNPDALVRRGESAYYPVKTFPVDFYTFPSHRLTQANQPQQGADE